MCLEVCWNQVGLIEVYVYIRYIQNLDANPGGTLHKFNDYIEQIELLFKLTFRKNDGSAFEPSDDDKKSMLLFKGGKDMKTLFKHVGKVLETDNYAQSI